MRKTGIILPMFGFILILVFLNGCGAKTIDPSVTLIPTETADAENPAASPVEVYATATLENTATPGPYTLTISDSYPFFITKLIVGVSLVSDSGKVWIGTLSGSIEEVDAQNGAFGKRILGIPNAGPSSMTLYPIMKMDFEGDYLWALGKQSENGRARPYLMAIDTNIGMVVQQWDLDSSVWMQNKERMFPPEEFGISPGKIWIDNHIINAQTFAVTADIYMPAMTRYGFNGMDWMWMTGDTGSGDGLVFVNTDNPSDGRYQTRWPFLVHQADGSSGVGPGNPLELAGERIWIGRAISGETPIYSLEAYTANVDKLMNEKGPLASVPLLDSYQKIKMLYAGNYLWVIYTLGEKAGFLCQLDPQTGETINSLDLVGDQGRSISDVPQDLASEGDNLWVLTTRQLLRIKLP